MSLKKKESSTDLLDNVDYLLLNQLQSDARISNSALSQHVNLSETPCWRRWKKLESEGYIEEYRTVLNRKKLGFGVVVFTQVSFSSHDLELTDRFEQLVNEFAWVQMCHCVTGSNDYLLKLVARDMDEFSDRITQIRRIPGVNAIQSHISVKEIKSNSSLPIDYSI